MTCIKSRWVQPVCFALPTSAEAGGLRSRDTELSSLLKFVGSIKAKNRRTQQESDQKLFLVVKFEHIAESFLKHSAEFIKKCIVLDRFEVKFVILIGCF